jgi:ribonuclease D
LKAFTGRASRSYLDFWWQAIQAAHKSISLPPVRAEKNDSIPNHRNWAVKFPEADRRLRHARNALTEISKAKNLPLENLLTPDLLRQVCFAPPQPATLEEVRKVLANFGARSWQLDLTVESITESINRLDEPDPKPMTHQE